MIPTEVLSVDRPCYPWEASLEDIWTDFERATCQVLREAVNISLERFF